MRNHLPTFITKLRELKHQVTDRFFFATRASKITSFYHGLTIVIWAGPNFAMKVVRQGISKLFTFKPFNSAIFPFDQVSISPEN